MVVLLSSSSWWWWSMVVRTPSTAPTQSLDAGLPSYRPGDANTGNERKMEELNLVGQGTRCLATDYI